MGKSIKLKIEAIQVGEITQIAALKALLYAGGNLNGLLKQPNDANFSSALPFRNDVWVVNPAFQSHIAQNDGGDVRVVPEGENWSARALQAAITILESDVHKTVLIAAADENRNRIVLRVGNISEEEQPACELHLLNLQANNQQTATALQEADCVELTHIQAGDATEKTQALLTGLPSLRDAAVGVNLFSTATAFTALFQWVRASVSIQTRTHYGRLDSKPLPHLVAYTRSVPWFLQSGATRRSALLIGDDTKAVQLQEIRSSNPIANLNRTVHLVVLPGNNLIEIERRMDAVENWLQQGFALEAIEFETWRWLQEGGHFSGGIVASSVAALRSELELARKGIANALEKGREWQSRAGSFFTPNPLGPTAKIAFVYPGAFNSYVGMGAELLRSYPFLHDWLSEHTEDAAETYQAQKIFPPNWGTASQDELMALQESLLANPLSMLFSGTAVAGLYTHLLENVFDVHPDVAFGYSMGETSMFFASSFWQQTGQMKREITALPLFQTRLANGIEAVREYWDEMGYRYQPENGPIWDNLILMTTFDKAIKVVSQEPQVYITHINAKRQIVIGGEPTACQRVLTELRCMSFPIPFHYPMHCEAIASEFDTLRDLHLQPVEDFSPVKFYSSYECAPFTLESATIAESIAGGLCNRVDFASLTNRVYADGVSIFIEVGARSNCAKWIENTLKSKQICCVSVNQAEVADEISLMKVIARLVSHGKTVRLPESLV